MTKIVWGKPTRFDGHAGYWYDSAPKGTNIGVDKPFLLLEDPELKALMFDAEQEHPESVSLAKLLNALKVPT